MKNKKYPKPPFLSTSFSESGKKLRIRFENILNTKKKKTGVIILLMIFAAALLFGGCVAINRNSSPSETSEPISPVAVVGNDDRGTSDIILVLEWEDESKTLNIVQIPRDTRSSSGKKLGTAYFEGTLIDELRLIGYNVGSTVSVKYEAFRNAVNAVGGVTLDVPIDMHYSDPYQNLYIDLAKGEQTLDGEHAEMLIRYRKGNDGSSYANGDLDRLGVQNNFYSYFLDKFLSTEFSDDTFNDLINSIETSMTIEDKTKYVQLIGEVENINIQLLPGHQETIEGTIYYIPENKLS